MPYLDFTKRKEPYQFIKDLMKGYTEEEIQEAHDNFCEYLNYLARKVDAEMRDENNPASGLPK